MAWLVPGAGHWYMGKRNRAVVIAGTICTTFMLGIILGSIEVIDPQQATAWFCAQILCGIPTMIAALIQQPNLPMGYGRGIDLGQVYAGIAGLLNLMCILDALVPDKTITKK